MAVLKHFDTCHPQLILFFLIPTKFSPQLVDFIPNSPNVLKLNVFHCYSFLVYCPILNKKVYFNLGKLTFSNLFQVAAERLIWTDFFRQKFLFFFLKFVQNFFFCRFRPKVVKLSTNFLKMGWSASVSFKMYVRGKIFPSNNIYISLNVFSTIYCRDQ